MWQTETLEVRTCKPNGKKDQNSLSTAKKERRKLEIKSRRCLRDVVGLRANWAEMLVFPITRPVQPVACSVSLQANEAKGLTHLLFHTLPVEMCTHIVSTGDSNLSSDKSQEDCGDTQGLISVFLFWNETIIRALSCLYIFINFSHSHCGTFGKNTLVLILGTSRNKTVL